MMPDSVGQDLDTNLWHWYDEVWNRSKSGYQTRAEAVRVQNAYVRRVLESGWAPRTGDYCWWFVADNQSVPVRVVGPASDPAWDWAVRRVTEKGRMSVCYDYDLMPMIEMEVIAASYADGMTSG